MKKDIFYSVCLALAVGIILFTPACVKVATKPTTQPESGSQQPQIVSLTAAQSQTYPGGTVNLQSVVTNPANDVLEFKWTATGGSFVEQGGANNTWRAPTGYGDYEIKLTVTNGKGATTEAITVIKVAANHPPTINSLTADPPSVQYDTNSTLTCIATDQDGDPLQYKWEAKEGKISGVGNKVTWTSPAKNGNFSIFITVSDGKGAEARQEIIIPVAAPTGSQTLNLVKSESGTVSSDGDKDTSTYKAGDDDKNIGYRAFFSFNIFPLWNMDIKEGKLKFIGGKVVGDDPFDPITGVGGFQIRYVSYGSTLPKFNFVDGGPVARDPSFNNKQFYEVDVTPELINAVSARQERFQIEAGFMKKTTNGNNVAQYIQWSDVVLSVVAQPK
jgi:PKD repeat protein